MMLTVHFLLGVALVGTNVKLSHHKIKYMNKEIQFLISLLKQTPLRLKVLINDLDDSLLQFKPNLEHFSILDILGHLIHGEDKDWIPRLQITLQEYQPKFTSFDRIGHLQLIEDTVVSNLQKPA